MTKKTLFILVLVTSELFHSCKKETFVPCSGFEELYGEWESINSDTPRYLNLGENDCFEYIDVIDRSFKMQMTSCFESNNPVGQKWAGYYYIELNKSKKDNESVSIYFSLEKDTIGCNSEGSFQGSTWYVRKK